MKIFIIVCFIVSTLTASANDQLAENIHMSDTRPVVVQGEDTSNSEFTFNLSQSYLGVKGKDDFGETEDLTAGASPGLELMWSLHVNEKFWFDLGGRYQSVNFKDTSDKDFKDKNQSLSRTYFGVNWLFASRLRFELQAGQGEHFLYRAFDASTLKIDKVAFPYAQAGIRFNVAETRNTTYALRAFHRHHFAFSDEHYTIGNSPGFLTSLVIEQRLNTFVLLGEIFYSKDDFRDKNIDFTQSEIGLQLGIRYRFEQK